MTFHIITLFPESFQSYIESSITGRAISVRRVKVKFYNPRDFATPPKDKSRKDWFYRQTDARPYGGGPGMVMTALPILKAVEAVRRQIKSGKAKTVIFGPSGEQFSNQGALAWAGKYRHLILICGRYEGVDARVKKILRAEEVSIGPYVLTGGELPAMVVLDAVSRQIPGVLGRLDSLEEKRISSSSVYTRPEILEYRGRKYRVPKVLLSGDHREIDKWRLNA